VHRPLDMGIQGIESQRERPCRTDAQEIRHRAPLSAQAKACALHLPVKQWLVDSDREHAAERGNDGTVV